MSNDDFDIDSLKKQLISQVDSSTLDNDSKSHLKDKINSSSKEELISLISQSASSSASDEGSSSCIFCSIFSGSVNSYRVMGDDDSLAVFEINPLSRGHIIIIPKVHGKLEVIPDSINSMIKSVTSKIQSSLDPDKVEISKQELMGHTIINAIPIYGGESLSKKQASPKDLEELMEKFSKQVINLDIKKEVVVMPDNSKAKKKSTIKKSTVKSDKGDKKLSVKSINNVPVNQVPPTPPVEKKVKSKKSKESNNITYKTRPRIP